MNALKRTDKWLITASFVLAACLSGCLSTPLAHPDSPMPAEISVQSLAPCTADSFATGKACFVVVQSEARWSKTALTLVQGQTYCITVPAGQFWFDQDRLVPAPQGDDGGTITRPLGFLKRQPDAKWFSLMAGTEEEDSKAQNLGALLKDASTSFIPQSTGTLRFFANDTDTDYTYGNNHGRIFVILKAGACKP